MAGVEFFDLIESIDQALCSGDIDQGLSLLKKYPKEKALRKYFFDKVPGVGWLKSLEKEGLFSKPPYPDRDEQRGTVGFPVWPESQYLARMASQNPELVLDVILKMPETYNVRVYEDLADAALAMPPEFSVKLIEKAKIWAQSPYQHLLAGKLGKFVSKLARAGFVDQALDLAQVILQIISTPEKPKREKKNDTFRVPKEPTARLAKSEYESILKKNIPDLVTTGGIRTFDLLCDLLERAVGLSRNSGKEGEPEDYSWIWRPAVENHPQNREHGFRDLILNSVRATGETLIRSDEQLLLEIVKKLESRPWRIFHRIALYLLREFPDNAKPLIAERLTNRALFDDTSRRHEYAKLLERCFSTLFEQQQQLILEWIEEGPDLEEFKKTRGELHGDKPTDEDAKRYKKYWQAKRLKWFEKSLPEEWKERYKDLTEEIGVPKHPEFETYSTSWVGPTSPKDADEIKKMSVSDIAEFLRAWVPAEDRMNPSPEGLGRVLSSVINEDPARFSTEAIKFAGLHPTYVRAFLSGLRDSLKKGRSFDWAPVLNLCDWVLEQPRELNENCSKYRDGDPHWGWTLKNIADLLSSGFEASSGYIPFEFRERVWRITEQLTRDPEPTPEDEAKYDSFSFEPANLAINTTRGEAMHTMVQYALWTRRHIEKGADGKDRIDRGFEEMPEVRDVLEKHLDPSVDPSLAIRSVYGQRFPWLVLLDENWARENTERIFPGGEEYQAFFQAAWNTYLTFCQAYDNVFDVLRRQYKLAVDSIPKVKETKDDIMRPNVRLAEHLMVFYWRGKVDLEEGGNLLREFWKIAPPDIRGQAIDYVGRSLSNTEEEVPSDILKRLKGLWEWRLSEFESSSDITVHIPELESFGWWFASGKFDDSWAMKQILGSLAFAKKTDPDYRVVERLAELSEKMPLEAVQCLKYLCEGDKEGWEMHGWKKYAKTILGTALKSEGAVTEAAKNLIHYLGSRGWFEFGELLKSK